MFLVSSSGPTNPDVRRALAAAGLFHVMPAAPTGSLADQFTPGRVNIVVAAVDSTADEATLDWVKRIRHHRDPNVALAPLVAIGRAIRPADLGLLIRSAFDDVLVLPTHPGTLIERLNRTLVSPAPFFRTPDYFGPDRRRAADRADDGGIGERTRPATRITVSRSALAGCAILDEVPVAGS